MKIFDNRTGWNDRVNFVDINNVVVGYDMSQQCCENAGYLIMREPAKNVYGDEDLSNKIDLDDYVFDTAYDDTHVDINLPEGGHAVFRMVNPAGEQLFLTLYNCHNGYYCHGFTVHVDDEIVRQECL